MTELELIIQDLDGIGTELFNKYGTESYNIRCKLHDIKDQLKAINYSQCCTQLKGKKKPTFEEWIEKCGMQKVGNRIILKNNNQVSLGFMLEIYSGQINSGLL